MINILEIGFDNFLNRDLDRSTLHKERRGRCSLYVDSYNIILYAQHINERLKIERENNKLSVYYIGGNKFLSFFRIIKLSYSIIKREEINIISCIDPFTYGFIGVLLKFIFKIPLNVQMHYDYFDKYFWENSHKIKKIYNLFLAWLVLKNSDSIRIVSTLQKEKLNNIGISSPAIEIIPTPVEIPSINIGKLNICDNYRTDLNTKILLYVGRIEDQKDLGTLLKAFKIIKSQYNNVKLLIIGMGSWETKLKVIAKELIIENEVFFLGSINHNLIFSYYLSSDIFVITSKWEGRGTVVTEAALCRKPVVATRFCGSQDSIIDGETGFIVSIEDYKKFAEQVLFLLNNPQLIIKFGEKGYQHVSENIKKVNDIKALADLWKKTINNLENN